MLRPATPALPRREFTLAPGTEASSTIDQPVVAPSALPSSCTAALLAPIPLQLPPAAGVLSRPHPCLSRRPTRSRKAACMTHQCKLSWTTRDTRHRCLAARCFLTRSLWSSTSSSRTTSAERSVLDEVSGAASSGPHDKVSRQLRFNGFGSSKTGGCWLLCPDSVTMF